MAARIPSNRDARPRSAEGLRSFWQLWTPFSSVGELVPLRRRGGNHSLDRFVSHAMSARFCLAS